VTWNKTYNAILGNIKVIYISESYVNYVHFYINGCPSILPYQLALALKRQVILAYYNLINPLRLVNIRAIKRY